MMGLAALLAGFLTMTTFAETHAVASTTAATQNAAPVNQAASNTTPANEDAAPAAVKIDNFSFSPNTITVTVGQPVRWTNHDDVPHNVVADDKSFKSKAMDTDENFTYTFTKPGTYSYFCGLHPKMTGKIVVK
jgi:plastocyanin